MTRQPRTFEDKSATRERVPLLVGLAGPSGGGKTFSALRLATGMQRVTGGDIFYIDTESRRALHYADSFKFRHVPFAAPFSPMDYLEAIEHCVGKGAGIVVVDSMSHEHEGPGGVLEWHDREVERLAKAWNVKAGKAQIPAWNEPKKARRRLINSILQLGVSGILCFRAKEKIAMKGDKVIDMGWSPIAGEEFIYEQVLQCLLLPGSGGVPTWNAERPGEKAMTKLPEQFKDLFADPKPLSEEIGVALAQWAEGTEERATEEEAVVVLKILDACETKEELTNVAAQHRNAKPWTASQRTRIKKKIEERLEEFRGASNGQQEMSG